MVAKLEFKPRRTHRRSVFLLLWGALMGLFAASGIAQEDVAAPEAVYGIWASSGTMIEVKAVAESLSARIVALKNPNWREKDERGEVGSPKTDLRNPDASKHQDPLLGLEMLSDYSYREGKWRGTLYLPTNGSQWKSTLRVKNGELLIRGYVGLSLFGKTQTFAPIRSCNENVLRMIEVAGLADTPCANRP